MNWIEDGFRAGSEKCYSGKTANGYRCRESDGEKFDIIKINFYEVRKFLSDVTPNLVYQLWIRFFKDKKLLENSILRKFVNKLW